MSTNRPARPRPSPAHALARTSSSRSPRRAGSSAIALALAITSVVGCGVVACQTALPPSPPPRTASDTFGPATGPSGDDALDLSTGRTPRDSSNARSASSWTRAAEATGELFSVVDGLCHGLAVSELENGVVVHMKGPSGAPVLASARDDGLVVDAAMNQGLTGYFSAEQLVGRWPDAAYMSQGVGSRCDFGTRALHYQEGRWRDAFAIPAGHGIEHITRYGSGAIGLRTCHGGCGEPSSDCVPGMFIGDNATAPPITGDGFRPSAFEVLSTGGVVAVGVVCPKKDDTSDCAAQLRWWSPGAKVGYTVLGKASLGEGSLAVRSPTEIFVATRAWLGTFDGAKTQRIAAPAGTKTTRRVYVTKGQGVWVHADDRLFRRADDGSYHDVTPPDFTGDGGDGGALAGLAVGAPWYLSGTHYAKSRALYMHSAGSWRAVDLPKPAFASSPKSYLTPAQVVVHAPDDVYVVATYHEMPNGWNEAERRRVLLRTRRPKETLRCGGPGHFESWPAVADDACATPFVVLAPVSATSPADFDYPQTRAVMKAKVASIADGAIAEIRENGRVWIGVVPRTVADGRKLQEHYATQFPMTRPEVVCATPNVTRRIPIAKRD